MELLKRGWLIVKRRWALLVAPILIGLIAAAAYMFLMPREYTASSTLFLRAPDVKSSASAYQGNLFTVQRANTYVKLIKSDDLAQLVVDRLGLNTSAHDLASKVDATPLRDTVIITIDVTDPDAQQAANLANTYGTEFATYVARVEAAELAPDTPPLVTIVKPANADDATSNLLSPWLIYPLGAIAGLLIGILLVWLAERYDTKIRSRRQIEEVTHSHVLGSLAPQRNLRGSESVNEIFEQTPDFANQARVLSLNTEHALREISKSNGAAVLTVASAKDGDGKSVVARSIATALGERGHRAGVLHVGRDGISSDVASMDGPTQAIRIGTNGSGPSEQSVSAAIEDMSSMTNFIIVDPDGSGASPDAQISASVSDAVVVVVRPGHTDENELADLVNAMTMLEAPVIGVVTNRAKETNTTGRFYA